MSIKVNNENNAKLNSLVILGLVTGAVWVAALVGVPHWSQATTVKGQVHTAQTELKKTRATAHANAPYQQAFNLTSAEQTASDKIENAVTTMLGGVKSADDLKANQVSLQATLGISLYKALLPAVQKEVTIQKGGYYYPVTKNDGTIVTFQDVSDITHATIIVVTTYEDSDSGTHKRVITLDWNLEKQVPNGGSVTTVKLNS